METYLLISQAFQRCYLKKDNTRSSFLNLINNHQGDYSRYIFFYINYLIENKKIEEAKAVAEQLEYIILHFYYLKVKAGLKMKNLKNLIKFFHAIIIMI